MTLRLIGRGLVAAAIALLVAGLWAAAAHPERDWMNQRTDYCTAAASRCTELARMADVLTGLGLLAVVLAMAVSVIGRAPRTTPSVPASGRRITACIASTLLVLALCSGLFAAAFVMVAFAAPSSTAELALLGLGWLLAVLALDATIRACRVVRPRAALAISTGLVTGAVVVAGAAVFGHSG